MENTKTVWIAAVDMDSFNYFPKEVKLTDLLKEDDTIPYYETEELAQKACDHENSL